MNTQPSNVRKQSSKIDCNYKFPLSNFKFHLQPIQRTFHRFTGRIEAVKINPGRFNAFMTEQLLDNMNGCPGLQEMRGKRMSQGMSWYAFLYTGQFRRFFDLSIDCFRINMMPSDFSASWILCKGNPLEKHTAIPTVFPPWDICVHNSS